MDTLLVIWLGIVPAVVVVLLFVNVAVNNMVNNHARANGRIPLTPHPRPRRGRR